MLLLTIQPSETRTIYGVNSSTGYEIYSKINLQGEVDKIKDILAAYVKLQIAKEYLPKREEKIVEKLRLYSTNIEELDGKGYIDFKDALIRRNRAEMSLNNIKHQYQVIHIKPFD